MTARRVVPRRGALFSVELLLFLPLLALLAAGLLQLAGLARAQQRFSEASREAARVAARGGDLDEVARTARGMLGDALAEGSKLVVERRGDPDGGRRAVVVRVAQDAARCAPNLLPFLAQGRTVEGVAVQALE